MNALSKSRPGTDQRVAVNARASGETCAFDKSAENHSLFAGTVVQDNSKRERLIDRQLSNSEKPAVGGIG